MPPAAAANSDAGILNQLLALNELSPPETVMDKDGYICAFEIPAFAFAMVSSSSLVLTSGRFCNNCEGIPEDSSLVN